MRAGLEEMLMAVVLQGGFPVRLTALRELRELELTLVGPGAFVTLPNSITNWQELRDLQLYRCGLEKLPECISALSKLDSLLMEGFRSGFYGFALCCMVLESCCTAMAKVSFQLRVVSTSVACFCRQALLFPQAVVRLA